MTPARAPRRAAIALALVAAASLAACGDGGSDPATSGPVDQAVEKLQGLGLDEDTATCIVDELGADTVVEAGDLNALTESQTYRDAAEGCADEG